MPTAKPKVLVILHDGGRKSSGYGDERNDCVVRAIAYATNTPYGMVHEWAGKKCGRKPRHRTSNKAWTTAAVKDFGLHLEPTFRPSVAQWLENHQEGRWVVVKRGHAVVDGIVIDNHKVGPRCIVKAVFVVAGWPKGTGTGWDREAIARENSRL